MGDRQSDCSLTPTRSVSEDESRATFDMRPRSRFLKLRSLGFQPQRGDAMPAQGNALGWRIAVNLKP